MEAASAGLQGGSRSPVGRQGRVLMELVVTREKKKAQFVTWNGSVAVVQSEGRNEVVEDEAFRFC